MFYIAFLFEGYAYGAISYIQIDNLVASITVVSQHYVSPTSLYVVLHRLCQSVSDFFWEKIVGGKANGLWVRYHVHEKS